MINFTLNNHLQFRVGGRLFGQRLSPKDRYEVSMGAVDLAHYKASSFRDELMRTADCVLNDLGKDLIVYSSGGTDSEIVIRNFMEIGYKPRTLTIRFSNDTNAQEVSEAEAIARELGLKCEVIDFDIVDFYKSGAACELAIEFQNPQIAYLMLYYHFIKLQAPTVVAGELLVTKHYSLDGSFWYYSLREAEDAGSVRLGLKYNIPFINEWFSYTPELMMYYLRHEGVQQLMRGEPPYRNKISAVSSKNRFLQELYPAVRPKIKATGMEKMYGFNQSVYAEFKSQLIPRLEPCLDGISINDISRQNPHVWV